MRHQTINPIETKEEMITAFTGYDHRITATEGSYFDMQNMSSDYYPAMSPRKKRSIIKNYADGLDGMYDYRGSLITVTDGKMYDDDDQIFTGLEAHSPKDIVSIGSKIVVFPDNKYVNRSKLSDNGSLGNKVTKNISTSFTLVREDGTAITWHDATYYENNPPQNGDYKMETLDGKTGLYVYSASAAMWSPVATTYMKIECTGLGSGFNAGDGVKVTVDLTGITWDYASNIFVNDEGSNKRSNVFVVKKTDTNYLVVPALLDENKTFTLPVVAEREIPEFGFVVECQNRLWASSYYDNEIMCCKLGDPTNWSVYEGLSTDSWRASLGSNEVITGAIVYQGNPIFFRENSMIKVSISATGAHSLKEIKCKGVATYAEKSLAIVNDILYYKSVDSVCAYDGSYPVEISNVFGDVRYREGIGGAINNKYYLCVVDENERNVLFVYDTRNGIWIKEGYFKTKQFCTSKLYDEDLEVWLPKLFYYYWSPDNDHPYACNLCTIDETPTAWEATCTVEGAVDWYVESNNIGYLYTGKSYRSRINKKQYIQKMIMQVSLAVGSHISVYINYDSSDEWEFLYNFSGSNANLCKIPIRPHRCNHFRYKIVGHGDAKIFSITKYYTEGSDV